MPHSPSAALIVVNAQHAVRIFCDLIASAMLDYVGLRCDLIASLARQFCDGLPIYKCHEIRMRKTSNIPNLVHDSMYSETQVKTAFFLR